METIAPDAHVLDALETILARDIGHLIVATDDQMVGLVTRTDLLRAQTRHLEHEVRQPGLHLPGRGAPTSDDPDDHTPTTGDCMHHYLVIANQTLGGPELTGLISARCDEGPASFHVVVPATRHPQLLEQVLDAYAGQPGASELQAAERIASMHLTREVDRIRALGADADGEVGDPDPLAAARGALAERTYDEVILSTLPAGASRWLGLDLPHRLARAVGRPITHVAGPPAEAT